MKKILIIAAAVLSLASCKNAQTETPAKKVDAQKFFKDNIAKVEDLCMEELQQCSELIQEDIYEKLDPAACVAQRKTTGGPSPVTTAKQIKFLQNFCKKNRK